MMLSLCRTLLLVFASSVALAQVPSDWAAGVASSQLLFAQSEPTDRNFMPAIANGFLGTVVGAGGFSVGGVYNGYNYTTPSHRCDHLAHHSLIELSKRCAPCVARAHCYQWQGTRLRTGYDLASQPATLQCADW